MWTTDNRSRYDRSKFRYPSDLTDKEWQLVESLVPPGKRGGGKRTVVMREIVNGLTYILSTGRQWATLPKDLPPKSTGYDYFDLWSWDRPVRTASRSLRRPDRRACFGGANSMAAVRRVSGLDTRRCAPGRRRATLADPRRSFLR